MMPKKIVESVKRGPGRPPKVLNEVAKVPVLKNSVVNVEDLCKLIKSCALSNVIELKMGDLHMVFGKRDHALPTSLEPVETKPLEQEAKTISDQSEHKDLVARVEQDLEELKLSDPHAWEKIIGGELGDVGAP